MNKRMTISTIPEPALALLDPQTQLPGPEALFSALHQPLGRFTLLCVQVLNPHQLQATPTARDIKWTAHLLRHVAQREEGIYRIDHARFAVAIDGSVERAGTLFQTAMNQELEVLNARTLTPLKIVAADAKHIPGLSATSEVLHQALRRLRQKVELERVEHAFQNLALVG
jgi:hypothetical protein